MAKFSRVHIRLSAAHMRVLKKMQDQMGLDRTNVIRLAVARLAEEEELRLAARKNAILNELAEPAAKLKSP